MCVCLFLFFSSNVRSEALRGKFEGELDERLSQLSIGQTACKSIAVGVVLVEHAHGIEPLERSLPSLCRRVCMCVCA